MVMPAARPVQGGQILDHPRGYAKVMNDVARSRLLTPDLLGIYTLIAGYAGADGECWQEQQVLADYVGVSVRTFQRHLAKLIKLGFIEERIRRHGARHGEERGRSYRLSDQWRRTSASRATAVSCDSAPTGEVARQIRSDSHDRSGESHTTNPAALKRTRLKAPEKSTPEYSGSGGRGGADAPAPPPETTKPQSNSRRATRTLKPAETPAPDTIELTDTSYASAEKLGYTRIETDRELDAFLTKARAKGWHYVNWRDGFKSWLIGEIKWGRGPATLGPLAPARPTNGSAPGVIERDGVRYRKDGSRIYSSEAGSKFPADMQARLDANTRY